MPQLAGLANTTAYTSGAYLQPGAPVTGAGAMRAASLAPMTLYATMQGQMTLTEHLYTVSAIMPPVIQSLLGYFGVVMAETAKEIHFPHIDTRATYDSIRSSPVVPLPTGGSVEVSVSTPQAQFLEFGFVHYQTGQWIFNPFMIPAADAVAPYFVDAVLQAAEIAGSRRFLSGMAAASPANDILASARQALYSYSKYAGDIQVLGFTGLSKSRGYAIAGAKGIGNIQAAQAGTFSARAVRLFAGKYGGQQIRFGQIGSGNLVSGPTGRIYNRLSGRIFGGSLSQIR